MLDYSYPSAVFQVPDSQILLLFFILFRKFQTWPVKSYMQTTNAGAKKIPSKLHCYRVRLRGPPREGKVWGLKTFLHLLCQPIVDRWLQANNAWKELAERIGPLVPAPD